jgi:hypothetical protein
MPRHFSQTRVCSFLQVDSTEVMAAAVIFGVFDKSNHTRLGQPVNNVGCGYSHMGVNLVI